MRWILAVPVILAIAAGGFAMSVAHAPPGNLLLWLPSVMAALPLVVPTSVGARVVAALWLLVFAVLGGFGVGVFYVPAALVMFIAALRAGPGGMELTSAARRWVRIPFGMTVAISAVWVFYMLHARAYPWPAYLLLLVPILAASPPLLWRKSEAMGTASALLAAFALFPITIEIGAWYIPAIIPMIYAAVAEIDRGN